MSDFPCDHRLTLLRVDKCDLCGQKKGQPFDVFACAKFGECSVSRMRGTIRSCAACEDRECAALGLEPVPEADRRPKHVPPPPVERPAPRKTAREIPRPESIATADPATCPHRHPVGLWFFDRRATPPVARGTVRCRECLQVIGTAEIPLPPPESA